MARDIPFPTVFTRHEKRGGLHSSRKIQEAAARFVTLFSHSTRSTSGKWTCNGENRTDHLLVGFRKPFKEKMEHAVCK